MVKIAEPMTVITDYVITIFVWVLAILLVIDSTSNSASLFIALSFLFTGIGSLTGGTAHGFKPVLSERKHDMIWTATTYSIGLASFSFVLAVILSSVPNNVISSGLIVIIVLQLVFYLNWMSSHNEFLYVIINYAVSMGLIIIMKLYSYFQLNDPSSTWVLSGILVSFLAAAIQTLEISPHDKYFNHNDLFHVVQLPGFYLIFKAAQLFVLY